MTAWTPSRPKALCAHPPPPHVCAWGEAGMCWHTWVALHALIRKVSRQVPRKEAEKPRKPSQAWPRTCLTHLTFAPATALVSELNSNGIALAVATYRPSQRSQLPRQCDPFPPFLSHIFPQMSEFRLGNRTWSFRAELPTLSLSLLCIWPLPCACSPGVTRRSPP